MTKAQHSVWTAIKEFTEQFGYAPSYQELCAITGKSSLSTIHKHVKHLVAQGALTATVHRGRSVRTQPRELHKDHVNVGCCPACGTRLGATV